MTISFISFEKSDETKKTEGYWCNNGMILITQKNHDDTNEYGGTSCSLKPSELKKVIESYKEDAVEPLLELEEVRPGLLPMRSRIRVAVQDKLIVITERHKSFIDEEFFGRGDVIIALKDAEEILSGGCKIRDDYEENIGIAPILGFNCRTEEKDVTYETKS